MVSTVIHPNDDMFAGSHEHYDSVGAQMTGFADHAAKLAGSTAPVVLELPCGYGRVTRHMVERFVPANMHVADIMAPSVDFCVETFGVHGYHVIDPIYEFRNIPDNTFDVAIMGSLITHLSEEASLIVLEHFFRKIRAGGVGVVTTHGVQSRERHSADDWYQVGDAARDYLIKKYDANEFGFVAYAEDHSKEKKTVDYIGSSYGISLIPRAWVESACNRLGLNIIEERPAGWDDHQDVFFIAR
ncbi:class I SAM-dependent methyltransferase [Paraburkholderia madseniana]|uniref:class I SAM-dependent methyltransferase n=1 Tax=Paraburkholderia madseniana TaxID=2599607 RepID=UPI001559A332|nr:class I SAM-dependent methyltransferase [Paraburkholderia madseniana]NPT66389.1 methyltransferase domain-containing protein [Paraburkholderia madseniana]